MNKNQKTLERRRRDFKKKVWESKKPTEVVKKLAEKHYLSEATVWKDITSE